jgi:hypothetical protein
MQFLEYSSKPALVGCGLPWAGELAKSDSTAAVYLSSRNHSTPQDRYQQQGGNHCQ